MSELKWPVSRPLRSRLLGCSLAALAAGIGGAAYADCLPSPPVAYGATTCSGTTNGGITVSVANTVTVASGAALNAGAGDDAAYTATTDASLYYGVTQTLNVNGTINGGATAAGVMVLSDPAPYYLYDTTTLNIVVGQSGVIEGATGLKLAARAGSTDGQSIATLNNSGIVRSTSGPAIVGATSRSGIQYLTNQAGGFIGGISAAVGTLTNAGVIDGGSFSAYATPAVGGTIYPYMLTNTGSMLSNGSAATVSLPNTFLIITNSGRIANLGSGLALDITSNLTNQVGGVIESAGPVAIRLGSAYSFTNRGTINGSVVSTAPSGYSGTATWDIADGVINGDLLLGSYDDTLIAKLDTTNGGVFGVTGRIDGGGGQNRVLFDIAQDTALGGLLDNITLPDNFQRFELRLSQNAQVTLDGEAPDGLVFSGVGGLTTSGKMASRGTALSTGYYGSSSIDFTNNGEITATFDPAISLDPAASTYDAYALVLGSVSGFLNEGSITSIGGHGVSVYNGYYGNTPFVNNGSITAYGTALSSGGVFENNGAIRSTNSLGVNIDNGYYRLFTNNGSIEGATGGVRLYGGEFTNNGSVSASSGVGVSVDYSGTIRNEADGVISGTTAAIKLANGYAYSVTVENAGVINGDVDLRAPASYYPPRTTYIDNGGKLNGNLWLGDGDDTFVTDLSRLADGKFTAVSGTVDAGAGRDKLVLRIEADTTASIDPLATFESVGVQMLDGASATLTATNKLTGPLNLIGQGKIDLTADISTNWSEAIYVYGDWVPYDVIDDTQLSIISHGAISYTQDTPWAPTTNNVVALRAGVSFENAGSLSVKGSATNYWSPIAIQGGDSVINSGSIVLDGATGVAWSTQFTNTGSLLQSPDGRSSIGVSNVGAITNSGTISTGGYAIYMAGYSYPSAPSTVTNSGLIKSTGSDAIRQDYGSALTITNQAGGEIVSLTGQAIHTFYNADTVRNDGSITGAIDLGGGDDVIENYGSITGAVALGDGNDSFVQWVGGTMTGVVDGGYGLDTLTIDSTGGGSVSGAQFINFERYSQIGGGSLTYSGAFSSGPITIDGGGATVLAGTSVTTPSGITFLGLSGDEQIVIAGSTSGGVSLNAGSDTVVNRGTIGGAVRLGSGNDSYTEGAGAVVNGVIDGGAGTDTFITELAGDRTGLRARAGFERLGLTGTGKLTLALDQNWEAVNLAGTGLALSLSGFTVGGVFGGDAAEAVASDGDIATVSLGGGDDSLILGGAAFAGVKNGGAGVDALAFTSTDAVTLTGAVSGFETVSLAGGRLDVSGSLGATGDTLAFGDGDQTLSILAGGQLSGTIDLGAGSDILRLAAGGQLIGTVLGGAGDDLAAIDLSSDLTLRGEQLQQFETLQVTGTGALNFTGAAKFDRLVTTSQNLTVAAGSSLESGALQLDGAANAMTVAGAFSGQLNLGGGDDVLRLTTGGSFTGSADGGAGNDRFELALGGTDAAPIALGATPFAGFETLSLQSGVVSLAGDYGFDRIEVANGRLIGLAGSRLTAGDITVASGATFGSAGTVVGDITVAGTLSPGASPGTMTVTGDVALAAGSTALFELTPTVSDKLVVSGVVSIAPGATLKLIGERPLTPGRTLDLIVASGGISGAFSTIDGAQALSLHIKQSANRLQALGLFTTDAAFSANVSGVVGALNTALIDEKASASLIAAMPSLVVAATGKSDPAALARITPQAYASASQLGAENGLTIVEATRAQARFAPDAPGVFGFGQAMTNRRKLDGDAAAGVNKGKVDSSGVLAGVGFGANAGWVGAFVGYLDGRERIADLGARTDTDSFVFGVQGQVRLRSFELGATLAHDAADADTQRALPGSPAATSRYKLKTWVGDVSLGYRAELNDNWSVRPRLGASYVRTQRDGVSEQGGGAFALAVQGDKATQWFADGQVELLGGQAAGQRLHPYVSAGFRTVIDGGDSTATATFGGVQALTATGLGRDGTVATVGAGLGYDLRPGLTLSATYAGEFGDGGRQGALVGLRWKF
jgi:hypothetical protein